MTWIFSAAFKDVMQRIRFLIRLPEVQVQGILGANKSFPDILRTRLNSNDTWQPTAWDKIWIFHYLAHLSAEYSASSMYSLSYGASLLSYMRRWSLQCIPEIFYTVCKSIKDNIHSFSQQTLPIWIEFDANIWKMMEVVSDKVFMNFYIKLLSNYYKINTKCIGSQKYLEANLECGFYRNIAKNRENFYNFV